MYGKWVTLHMGDCCMVEVYVSCTPDTPDAELQERAYLVLVDRLQRQGLELAAAARDAGERGTR